MNRLLVFNCVVSAILASSFSPHAALCQTSLPAPTPGEARIYKALRESTTFNFTEKPLIDMVNEVRQRHHIQVLLDNQALSDAGLGGHSPITISVGDISLRSALRLTLRELDLTYVVRDGYLLITSSTEAENMMESRIYPVGDLMTIDGQPASPWDGNYQSLMELITSTVRPTSWDEVGGPSPLYVFYPGRAMIIPQTQEVHEEIEPLLAALRAARDEQFKLAEHPRPPEPEKEDDAAVSTKIYLLGPSIYGRRMPGTDGARLPVRSPVLAQMGGGMGMGGMGMGGGAAIGPVDAKQIETWAGELAGLLPQLVEPKSWESSGASGMVRAFAGSLIVKQTGAVHREVAKLLNQLLPGTHVVSPAPRFRLPPVAPRGPLPDWTSEPYPRPGNAEAAIEEALATKTHLAFDKTPLRIVIEQLQNVPIAQATTEKPRPIPVIADNKALADAGIALDTPITFELSDVPLSESLRSILGQLDLTYVIAYEVLLITSKVEADNLLTTKVYPVLDLVSPGGATNGLASSRDYDSIIEILRTGVSAGGWDDSGGPGTAREYRNCGALVVSQTTEGHEQVRRLLDSLREARNRAEGEK